MSRKLATQVAAITGILVSSLLVPNTASATETPILDVAAAGPHHWMYTDELSHWKGGHVDFWPVGDQVQVCDDLADGRSVRAAVFVANVELWQLKASGKDQCDTRNASDPYGNLSEGGCYGFSVWLVENGRRVPRSLDSARWRNYNDAKVTCGE